MNIQKPTAFQTIIICILLLIVIQLEYIRRGQQDPNTFAGGQTSRIVRTIERTFGASLTNPKDMDEIYQVETPDGIMTARVPGRNPNAERYLEQVIKPDGTFEYKRTTIWSPPAMPTQKQTKLPVQAKVPVRKATRP